MKGCDETPVRAPKALVLILVWFGSNVVHFTYEQKDNEETKILYSPLERLEYEN